MESIKISRAKISDVHQIYLLGKRIRELDFSAKYPFYQLSELKESVSRSKENCLLTAKSKDTVVGFILAKILSHPAGGWCLLDDLGVAPEYRNMGLGKSLLNSLYKEMKARKINYIQILESNNRKTRSFWKKMGFRETKTFIWAEKTIKIH